MKSKFIKLIISVVIVILIIEIILRVIEPKISKDIVHYNQMDKIVKSLDDEKNILFLGNSLTRHGINKHVFQSNLKDFKIGLIYPDDTTIIEWFWIFTTKIKKNKEIKKLIIPFAPGQLDDRILNTENLNKLSRLVPTSYLIELINKENLSFNQSFTLILSHFSVLYGSKEKIQRRVLDILPFYRESIQKINNTLKKNNVATKAMPTNRHLFELINSAMKQNMKLIFVEVPLPSKYKTKDNIINIFKKFSNIKFITNDNFQDIKENDFLDGYHLNEKGSLKFSKKLLKVIGEQ